MVSQDGGDVYKRQQYGNKQNYQQYAVKQQKTQAGEEEVPKGLRLSLIHIFLCIF